MERPAHDPLKTLDYSTLSQAPNLAKESERDRREQLENYNLTTYGDRRPFQADLFRLVAALVAIGVLCALSALLLPDWIAELVTSAGVLAFVIWRRVRQIH